MPSEDSSNRQLSTASHGGVQSTELAVRARDSLSQLAQFRGRAGGFAFALQGDTLVVRGTVPSYYLKQLLQTALKNLEGIRQIDNQVVVTAASDARAERARITRKQL